MFVVEPIGRSGGLTLFWKDTDQVTLRSYSKNHIDAEVRVEDMCVWRLTGFYGEPNRTNRRKTWDLLRNLARDSNLPWCVIGDLNNVSSQEDKNGGAPYPSWLIEGFNEVLLDTGLRDVELTGRQYTWERGRGTTDWMEIRIDRAIVSLDWITYFDGAKLYNLEDTSYSSDHCPIYLEPRPVKGKMLKKSFRFENAWLSEPMCAHIIKDTWVGHANMDLQDKINICGGKLEIWGKEITGSFGERIKSCKKQLNQLRYKHDEVSVNRFKSLKKELFKIFGQQEVFWRQRSKQLWLKSGDQNTRYFHATASARKRANNIQRLKDDNDAWVEWDHGLQEVLTSYFQKLYSADVSDWGEVVGNVPCTITENQNEDLIREVTREEVKKALFQMHPDKSPGPDGMTPAFFQKNWNVVGHDLYKVVSDFFNRGVGVEKFNRTNVVLIPKKKNPMKITDMRPISLCNVVSKVVTKVMANRLKEFLEEVISDSQSAFVPGRLITDNIMVSFEIMHYLKRKRRGKEGSVALKLDMSKAYDRVEWDYLEAILLKMGFNQWWVQLVMKCVRSVSYDFSHGGYEMNTIFPERGIRQGDPLSPYLFIICVEGLSAMLRNYEERKLIHGVKVCRNAPIVSHMLFADDCYVYCKASTVEASRVMEVLAKFEKASGQQVNVQKISVFFSSNTISYNRTDICEVLSMGEADNQSTYLGLPNILGRNKSSILGFVKERVRKRIQNWDGAIISKGGKEILIKTVVQALPSFAMSVFLLPLEITHDLERCMNKFWWQSSNTQKQGIHWMEWDKLTKHKAMGGLSFKNLRDYNLSMVGKQAWRLLTNPGSLVSRIYKARYYPRVDFLNAAVGGNPSFIWRSIWESKDILKSGARWIVGSGKDINVLHQPWLVDVENPYISSNTQGLEDAKVVSLMNVESKSWDVELISDMFNDRDKHCILNIPLRVDINVDKLYWIGEISGSYSVRSAYKMIQNQKGYWNDSASSGVWSKLWKIKVPSKVLHTCWRALVGCLPTMTQLFCRRVPVQKVCPVCGVEEETIIHALVLCPFAAACWHKLHFAAGSLVTGDFKEWFLQMLNRYSKERWSDVAMVCWGIWKARNVLVWKKKQVQVDNVIKSTFSYFAQWKQTQTFANIALFPNEIVGDGVSSWVKPQLNEVKVSVDAAIFTEQNAYGLGIIARNSEGEMVYARTGRYWGRVAPELVETMAVKEALSWSKTVGMKVTVESDCLVVVQAIRSKVPMVSSLGLVMEECRQLLSVQNNVELSFIKRSANMAAHSLARASYSFPDRTFSRSDVPVEVADCILNDLAT